MDLQPRRGDDRVAIPVTFDVKSSTLDLKMSRLYISVAILVLDLILWIVGMIIAGGDKIRIIISVCAFIIVPLICRIGIVEEYRYRSNFKRLRDHDYTYDYSLFWTIFDTSTTFPTIFYHTSGMNSIFVAFDKDVVVGKGNDSNFDHAEAISYAYQLMARKEISCIHIDYMDSVGKDSRLQGMFEDATRCENPELKDCILDLLDYMQYNMSACYSDYDVYCFSSKMRPDLFLDELDPILSAFDNANYIRHRILDRQDVRDLVASVFAVPDFSVTRTCDTLFSNKGYSNYIRIIWTEKDGKREIVNKTRAQMAEEARLAAQEREAKKNRRSRNKAPDIAVDLFDDSQGVPNLAQGKNPQTNAFQARVNGKNGLMLQETKPVQLQKPNQQGTIQLQETKRSPVQLQKPAEAQVQTTKSGAVQPQVGQMPNGFGQKQPASAVQLNKQGTVPAQNRAPVQRPANMNSQIQQRPVNPNVQNGQVQQRPMQNGQAQQRPANMNTQGGQVQQRPVVPNGQRPMMNNAQQRPMQGGQQAMPQNGQNQVRPNVQAPNNGTDSGDDSIDLFG